MIVCICHRVSDRDIVAAVRAGETCFESLQDETGLSSSCGCCHDCAREVFDAACAKASVTTSPVHVIRHAAVSATAS